MESLWVSRNNTPCHQDFDQEVDSDFKDNIKITNDDKNILDINIFTKLLKIAQDLSNFETHKTLFL